MVGGIQLNSTTYVLRSQYFATAVHRKERLPVWITDQPWPAGGARVGAKILGAHALDHADPRERWDYSRQLEASRVEQRAELVFRALPAAGADQHVNVIGGRTPTFVRRIDAQRIDALDDKQPAAGTHRATAVF